MNTYRNKHFESIAWNPGDGVYKAENFVFSPVSSLRSWHSHLFVWRLRKPVKTAQVCISNDRAVPTPGFKQYNSRPTQTKTTKQTYRSFDNFYFDFLFLMVYTKRKRKRSDSVLWQKPLHQQKCQKGKVTTQTTPQKSSIKQRLRTDLGRSVGVTTATQLVWLTGLRAHLPTNRNSRLIKRTHV